MKDNLMLTKKTKCFSSKSNWNRKNIVSFMFNS